MIFSAWSRRSPPKSSDAVRSRAPGGPFRDGQDPHCLGSWLGRLPEGLKVRFTTAAAPVHEFVEAVYERRLQRLQKALASQDLLIIDELGFVPQSKTPNRALQTVLSALLQKGVRGRTYGVEIALALQRLV